MKLNGYILTSRALIAIGVLAFLVSGPPGAAAMVMAVGLGVVIELLWRLLEETRAFRSILIAVSSEREVKDEHGSEA